MTSTVAQSKFPAEHFRSVRCHKARTICVSVDSSTSSQYALEWTLHNVVTRQDRLILLHIEGKLGGPAAGFASLLGGAGRHVLAMQGLEMEKSNFLEQEYTKLCRHYQHPFFKWHVVQHKSPKKAIVELVDDDAFEVDLLVMGSQADKLLGSVASYVQGHVTCPTLVIKETKKQRQDRVLQREEAALVKEKESETSEELKHANARAEARREHLAKSGHTKEALHEFAKQDTAAAAAENTEEKAEEAQE